jgi:hypothetical protein
MYCSNNNINSKNNNINGSINNNAGKESIKVTCADDVDLLMEHRQVEDLLREERLLPDGEREAVVAVGRVEDAGVIAGSEVRLNDTLNQEKSKLILIFRASKMFQTKFKVVLKRAATFFR